MWSTNAECILEKDIKPLNLFILNLVILPHEDTRQGRDKFPSRRVLALESSPYVTDQGPPGPLGVQVGVKLADLASTPEPLSGYEATVVHKYGEQPLPLLTRPCGLTGTDTCLLEPEQQQAHAPAEQRDPLDVFSALLDGPLHRPAASEPHRVHTDLADRTTGHGVKHDSGDRDRSSQRQNKRQQSAAAYV